MTRIEVPSETLVVEMGEDGLNIVETFMQMSGMDESAQVQCDICSKNRVRKTLMTSWK